MCPKILFPEHLIGAVWLKRFPWLGWIGLFLKQIFLATGAKNQMNTFERNKKNRSDILWDGHSHILQINRKTTRNLSKRIERSRILIIIFLGHPVAKHVWLLDRSWIQVECELDFSLNNASLYLTLITAHFRKYLDVLLHNRSMSCLTFSPRDYNLNQPANE